MKTAEQILTELYDLRQKYVVELNEIKQKLTTQNISSVLEWDTESIFVIEEILFNTHWIEVVKNVEEPVKYDDLLKIIKDRINRCIQDLIRKPWKHNSSSSIANIQNIAKADALVEELKMYSQVVGTDLNYKMEISILFI